MAKELPEFRTSGRCPKCGGNYGPTSIPSVDLERRDVRYHAGNHAGCPGGTRLVDDRWERIITVEHFDRFCPICGYGWVEAILPPHPPQFGDPWSPDE